MDKRRLIGIILFIAITVLFGLALYFVFFAKKDVRQPTPGQQPTGTTGRFPSTGEGNTVRTTTPSRTTFPAARTSTTGGVGETTVVTPKVTQVLRDPITNPAKDSGSTAKFYSQNDGRFYRVDQNGKVTPLSDQVFFNVQKVTWAPKNNESILEYPDGSNIYYNFETKKQVTLPKHWEEFSFSPTGDKIAAKSMGLSPENRWLVVSNPEGSETTLVEPMGNNADKVTVDWSGNKQIIALSRTGEALGSDRQEVLFVGLNGENFKSTIVEGRDLRTQWSTNGTKLLYSVYSSRSDFKPELWVVNGDTDALGTGRKYLNLNTWADKCTFGTDRYVYCGVPESLEAGSGFAPGLANTTPDTIVKIDVETGARTEIRTDGDYVIDRLFVGEDGRTLFFTDKSKPGLFRTSL
ncbi:MAG TPA: hypothetical protein VEA18_01355 [Candidatus Kapabacteria bacterium]|nr:hypothetical protein [Candidatus Kapabacteria bacterium]